MKAVRIVQLVLCLAVFYSCEEDGRVENPVSSISMNSPNARIAEYTFTGQEGDPISLQTAGKWTAAFNEQYPEGNQAHFFGYEILNQILAEEGSVGIRMYYGLDDNGDRQILLVGVNVKGEDLLPGGTGGRTSNSNIIGDASFPCPTYCNP